jgi:transposase
MLYVGLDLSRKRLDWQALDREGARVGIGAVPPDRDGLARLVERLGDAGEQVLAVIESMSGARFVHDRLELAGWQVRIANAVKARGIAPLACKTDKIDTWVLAELARLDLVPEIWLPDPAVRAERERARFRLHLVKHRSALKNRVHSILFQHGVPSPRSDLFGACGRRLLERLRLPEPWASTLAASLELIDTLDAEIEACERELRQLGADHRYVPLLMTCPGIGWVLAFTIASEIGDISRFPTPRKLVGYTGLCPRVRPVGRARPARPAAQERPRPPALGAGRGSPHRRPPPSLPADPRPHARPPRPQTRQQARRDRDRPPARRGDLAHAHRQPALRSGRRPRVLGRMTAPN